MMGSSFLLKSERGDDPARTLRMAEAIQRAGTRMSSLLQNLTDFVHLTTGRRRLELTVTSRSTRWSSARSRR